MHTLLIHQAFCAPGEAGGTRHFELARYAARDGQKFTVIASRVSYLSGRVVESGIDAECAMHGVNVVRAYAPERLFRGLWWRVWSFLVFTASSFAAALRAGRADVVMATTPPMFQTLSGLCVARLWKVPFLLEVRDLWPEFAIDLGLVRNRWVISGARWFEHWLYKRADHIIVNSPGYLHYLVKKGVSDDRITLIANGVDVGMFDPGSRGESLRSQLGSETGFIVTYAGAIGLANDIPTILRAARRLKDNDEIVFWIVGDGPERVSMMAMANDLGLSNVKFWGPQPKAVMKEVLAASDACIATLRNVPMFRTTYPNKVFDYMAAGRPVILGIDGVIRDVVE
ncbi:MAG: glycosyltransferase family 4 protein, partial [Verrucomicrobiae bacterium]|nr:glycosyltransferase family 4 protein [Verrucomicrobiae bacterium]